MIFLIKMKFLSLFYKVDFFIMPLEAFLYENNTVKCNTTLDKIDNKISHIKNICQLLSNICNCSKK